MIHGICFHIPTRLMTALQGGWLALNPIIMRVGACLSKRSSPKARLLKHDPYHCLFHAC